MRLPLEALEAVRRPPGETLLQRMNQVHHHDPEVPMSKETNGAEKSFEILIQKVTHDNENAAMMQSRVEIVQALCQ